MTGPLRPISDRPAPVARAVVCDHCGQPVQRDVKGWWVGDDGTADCGTRLLGHEVDGKPR